MPKAARNFLIAAIALFACAAGLPRVLPVPDTLIGLFYGMGTGCLFGVAFAWLSPSACDSATPTLRRRYLRDINSRNATARQSAERNAINTPVQGSAADLIKLAMVRVARELKAAGLKSRLVLQIHDELLFDVPRGEEPALRALVREAMVGALDLGVPLEVELGSGRTWLEAH